MILRSYTQHPAPKEGERKAVRRFAWIPTRVCTGGEGRAMVWLCYFYQWRLYTKRHRLLVFGHGLPSIQGCWSDWDDEFKGINKSAMPTLHT
ncbi:MAG: hypothetical protein WC756_03695 [Taibaiella sp.]